MEKQSLNRVFLIGRLGEDPVGKTTPAGLSVTTFSLATNESWKNEDLSTIEHVEWHSLYATGPLADFGEGALKKGQLIFIEGSLRARTWKEGGYQRKKIEILCKTITPLERKTDKNKK